MAGNPGIPHYMRVNFRKAITIYCRRHNITTAEAFADWLEHDPMAFINTMAKFVPKEMDLNVNSQSLSGFLEQQQQLFLAKQEKTIEGELIQGPPVPVADMSEEDDEDA